MIGFLILAWLLTTSVNLIVLHTSITSQFYDLTRKNSSIFLTIPWIWHIAVVQLPSHVWLFVISRTAACQASLSLTILEFSPSSCSLHQWCHPAVSFSDVLFSCPQSFPASGTFPMSHLFASDGQNTGVSASVLPVKIQGWSPLRLVWFPCHPRDFQEPSPASQLERIYSLVLFMVQFSQLYMTTGKTIALTIGTFVGRLMSLLFNTLSGFVVTFLPRSNNLLISWLQSSSAVIFGAQEDDICLYFHHLSPFYLPCSNGYLPWS